ncbi:hypothetical protein Bcep1808_4572 [Burkholderia vietnamiensis G4]|uniref:Uncharacterized protein n=1 Tax=Burkholderia vietnamiensis (strain G4 / LMG 22486) TaxID=269482 RepID=A4JMN2_BURVG|nr:hypothetical protein Bcep1808_4572 [Burkholderia vietnamiensis G4]
MWTFLPSRVDLLYAFTALTNHQTRMASRVLGQSTEFTYSIIGLQIRLGVSDAPGSVRLWLPSASQRLSRIPRDFRKCASGR